jgi:hypothetical protein
MKSDDDTVDSSDSANEHNQAAASAARKRKFKKKAAGKKSVVQMNGMFTTVESGTNPELQRHNTLLNVYDLDGDGELDEAELAMMQRDKEGRGHLTNEEIYQIVQDQLSHKKDVSHLKKVVCGLVCFVFILALSNLGTSFASAILAKETKVDEESGTMRIKSTNSVMGAQSAATTVTFNAYTNEEYRQRRDKVRRELMADPYGWHSHRILVRDRYDGMNAGARRLGRLGRNHVVEGRVRQRMLKEHQRRQRMLQNKKDKKNKDNGGNDNSGNNKKAAEIETEGSCKPGVDCSVTWDTGKLSEEDFEIILVECQNGKTVNVQKRFVEEWAGEENEDGAENSKIANLCKQGTPIAQKGKKGATGGIGKVQIGDITADCEDGECHLSGEPLLSGLGGECDLSRGDDDCQPGLICHHDDPLKTEGWGVCVDRDDFRSIWYMGWDDVAQTHYCVQSCRQGPNCGGFAEPHNEVHDNPGRCCAIHLQWEIRVDGGANCVMDKEALLEQYESDTVNSWWGNYQEFYTQNAGNAMTNNGNGWGAGGTSNGAAGGATGGMPYVPNNP